MTKYEQLKEELKKEAKKMKEEFHSKAKVGDFARLGETYGILGVVDYNKQLTFLPIMYGTGGYMPIPLTEENIPMLELLGNDFSAVSANLQEAAKAQEKELEEVPF